MTARPLRVLFVTALVLVVFGSFLPQLTKDSTNMANIHPRHPARVATDRVKEIFGLTDDGSMAVVVVDETPGGIFDPTTLSLIAWLTERIQELPGVDPNEVASLATERDIIGSEWGMEVRPFFEQPPSTIDGAADVREAVLDFALYVDSLAARNGDSAVVVAKLLEGADDTEVYWRLRTLVEEAPVHGEALHVTGIGAFNARIGEYLEADTRRLNPIAMVVILLILTFAYRTPRGTFLPALPAVGGVVVAFGSMAAFGIPVYTLTNSVSVILIAIGVCDGIHIMGQYYVEIANRPGASSRELAIRSMVAMWRPVLVTSLTTIVGFLVISATTNIPPMRWYGVFASIGVLAALALCVFALPALLTLVPPRSSPAFSPGPEAPRADLFARATSAIGLAITRRPRLSLGITAAVMLVALAGALRVQIDNSATNYLHASEPLHVAIDETNRVLGGVWNLDVLIEAADPDALYEPSMLYRIDALQSHIATLPYVRSTRSIVGYVKQMHRAMNNDDPTYYAIPDDSDLIAQYFLAYSASASPTDFEEVVDYDFQRANVRVALDEERASRSSQIVGEVSRYLHEEWDSGGLRVSLAGWVNLGHHWRMDIARSQWLGAPAALLAVGTTTALCFGSPVAGALSIVPAFLAVWLVYGVMGALGIWMDLANSVLAALALGVTVDFAVHTLDRLIDLTRRRGQSLEAAFETLFPSTGRALLFNFAAIALGFGVLASSHIPPVSRFGVLVVVCVTSSAVASLTVLPALVRVLRPRFLEAGQSRRREMTHIGLAALLVLIATAQHARAVEEGGLPRGEEVAMKINARDEGEFLAQRIRMELVDRRGKQRVRETRSFRRYYGDERRSVVFFEAPRNVKDTAFLTYDYPEPDRDDDQWLYLPAMRKVRRISGADRGRYFLGTDFTYEDIKNGTRVSLEDYRWKTLGEETLGGRPCVVVESTPVTEEVARELGYGRVVSWVDRELWMVRRFEAWDPNGNPLKAVESSDFRVVDGIWTIHRLEATNHKSGHRSTFVISDVDYETPVPDEMFTQGALHRGR